MLLHGIFPPITTPFYPDGEVYYKKPESGAGPQRRARHRILAVDRCRLGRADRHQQHGVRPAVARLAGRRITLYVLAFACLLGGFTSLHRIGRFHRPALAWRLFGRDIADDAAGQVSKVLASWGYHGTDGEWASAVCQLLLVNRSPTACTT